MTSVETVTLSEQDQGQRLDRWLRRRFPGLTQGRLEKLLRTGQIRLDGKRAKSNSRLLAGQQLRLPPLDLAPSPTSPPPVVAPSPEHSRDLRRRVLFRDDHLLVLDKPAGLAVQGGSRQTVHLDALLDALRFGHDERPRLVHRLDKDTSGVLVVARSAVAARQLTAAFRGHEVDKLYWAAVAGVPSSPQGVINVALAKRGGRGGEKMVAQQTGDFQGWQGDEADGSGKPAITEYRVLDRAGRRAAWLALSPQTGRTHQLRAHCAYLGTPIIGDGKYGGAAAFALGGSGKTRLHLHARSVALCSPSGQLVRAEAPLPPHMCETWRMLGFDLATR